MPVSVRPFRYTHIKKDEIEQQVSMMLAASIIRECGNLFLRSVMLVKKKDVGGSTSTIET